MKIITVGQAVVVIGLASLIPIWRAPGTPQGLNLWRYIQAMSNKPHVDAGTAMENYDHARDLGWI